MTLLGIAVRFRLAVERVTPNGRWESGSGEALVTLVPSSTMAAERAAPHVRYGDRLLLEGCWRSPRSWRDSTTKPIWHGRE